VDDRDVDLAALGQAGADLDGVAGLRSRSTDSAMPGRWTLTITASPVTSRAR
jgi:hypothetical protein